MMTLKTMLTENRNSSVRKGCLMAMVSKEDTEKLLKFNKQLIAEENLYLEGNEYGRETECHVTIRYGFLKDLNELEIRQLLKGQKKFMMEIYGLDKFDTHPSYDVAMFKVSSPVLKQLNEASGIYLNETDYPDYNPHLTLAYVQKGKFPHKKEGFRLSVPVKEICYSPISGAKSYFPLEEENTYPKIDVEIRKLEQEWERLDSTGTGSVRQQEITKEINRLKKIKEPRRKLDPNSPKVKSLWNDLHNSIK